MALHSVISPPLLNQILVPCHVQRESFLDCAMNTEVLDDETTSRSEGLGINLMSRLDSDVMRVSLVRHAKSDKRFAAQNKLGHGLWGRVCQWKQYTFYLYGNLNTFYSDSARNLN